MAPFYMIMAAAELGTIWMAMQMAWSPVPASVYSLMKPASCNDPINCDADIYTTTAMLDLHARAIPVEHFKKYFFNTSLYGSYLVTYMMYGLTSLPTIMLGADVAMNGRDPMFFVEFSATFGYWMTVVGCAFPWIMAVIYVAEILPKITDFWMGTVAGCRPEAYFDASKPITDVSN